MDWEKVLKVMDYVSKSNLTHFSLEEGNLKLEIDCDHSRDGKLAAAPVLVTKEPPAQEESPAAKEPEANQTKKGNVVTSPLVGVFYAAPAEDADPFVAVGDSVKKGQVLAIVEAMKLMNEIESEYDGTVAEILVENGEAVEYNQPLFRIV